MLPDFEEMIPEENIENSSFSFITEFKGNYEEEIREANIPDELPILPLRNMVLFPTTVLPISVGRESSLQLIKELEKSGGFMAVMCQKEATVETPAQEDLYPFGTVAKIVKVFEMPDNSTTVILQGYQKIQLLEITRTFPYHLGRVMPIHDIQTPHDDEFNLLIQNCRKTATKIFKANGTNPEAAFAMKNMGNDSILINFLCANIKAPLTEKIALLEEMSLKERAYHLLTILNHEKMLVDIQNRIQAKTQKDLDQQQKEYYLQQQLKTIQEELGGNPQDQDVTELRKKGSKKNWSKEVNEIFNKEVSKLERINPQTPDYHVQLNYLQLFVNLPWGEYSKDNLDINNAQKVLDHDHYGLEKVKERILEHLAVIKMRGDLKAPIICLYGPPGVGKTSL